VGTVTGIDHRHAFNDPEDGSSLWCLAISPQTSRPGVGRALVCALADRLQARGRAYIDLSVLHDNAPAIRLYEQLGFVRVPVFCVKRKNPINERLFSARPAEGIDDLNPYARIIADEALRRGITVEVVDAEAGFLKLSHGGRSIHTRESLSELTTAVAMSRCEDKRITRLLLQRTGLRVPRGVLVDDSSAHLDLLEECGEVVVKPARGEQGRGVTVGVRSPGRARAGGRARPRLRVPGGDGRGVRGRPGPAGPGHRRGGGRRRRAPSSGRRGHRAPHHRGARPHHLPPAGGEHRRRERDPAGRRHGAHRRRGRLRPRRRAAEGQELEVRRTANLHTGGTIHDVTQDLHPQLASVAMRAAEVLDIPVVGIDLLVPDPTDGEYVVIEANERPGLANHEPQPTAERFIDLLFPGTRALPRGWRPQAG
jgi:hypothetical protein